MTFFCSASSSSSSSSSSSIAIELLSDPALLFLDEPTSGLDSASALQVMQLLRNLADIRGCALIATLHQPSYDAWQLVDSAMFLVKGKVVYFGDPMERLLHFLDQQGYPVPGHANVPDFVLSVINEDFSQHAGKRTATVDQLVKAFNELKAQEEDNKIEAGLELSSSSSSSSYRGTIESGHLSGNVDDMEEESDGSMEEHKSNETIRHEVGGNSPSRNDKGFIKTTTTTTSGSSGANNTTVRKISGVAELGFKLTLHAQSSSGHDAQELLQVRASFCARFAVLCERDFKELIRDPGILGVRLLM
jgi:ABC-type sugar transport system ATPase subunit